MITVLADRHIGHIKAFLPSDITCITYDPNLGPDDDQLAVADALLIRTVTRVDEKLINRAPKLKFIGTATAGIDHVDLKLFNDKKIHFASAPGCNARSVAEYVATSIILWADSKGKELNEMSAGIIGLGNAGSEVMYLLEAIGLKTLYYDPPREQKDPGFKSHNLDDVLSCDIITLHVPLVYSGELPTYNWLDAYKVRKSQAKLFINSARGGVADENALLQAKADRGIDFILDVWQNEPVFDDMVAEAAFIKTPHIAGYSSQSKINATRLVCESLNRHFKLNGNHNHHTDNHKKTIQPGSTKNLHDIISQIHPIHYYDQQFSLLMGLPSNEKIIQFSRLRTEIPLRDEYRHLKLPVDIHSKFPIFRKLGISE